jgi:hypothetical protein
MRPPLPRSVKSAPLRLLAEAGLIAVNDDEYVMRGLDAERNRRRDAARTGAAKRWESERNANALPRRERDEKSRDEKESPPPPAKRGRRSDGTNPRAQGTAPRPNGTNPRANGASPRDVRDAHKRGPSSLHEILSSIQTGRKP